MRSRKDIQLSDCNNCTMCCRPERWLEQRQDEVCFGWQPARRPVVPMGYYLLVTHPVQTAAVLQSVKLTVAHAEYEIRRRFKELYQMERR